MYHGINIMQKTSIHSVTFSDGSSDAEGRGRGGELRIYS